MNGTETSWRGADSKVLQSEQNQLNFQSHQPGVSPLFSHYVTRLRKPDLQMSIRILIVLLPEKAAETR